MRLSEREADLLIDHLDMVLQGMSETWQAMVEDSATFDTVEEYLETLGRHEEDIQVLRDTKRKVERERQRAHRSGFVRSLRASLQGHAG
jgi:hypothetical protein